MKKTMAIKTARSVVSKPFEEGTSWVVLGPLDSNFIYGLTVKHQYSDYRKAKEGRTQWMTEVALYLMGVVDDENYGNLIDLEGLVQERVNTFIKRIEGE